jgi:hypothetical protein
MTSQLLAVLLGIVVGWTGGQRGDLPAQRSPIVGGAGGAEFTLACGPGHVLTGLRSRTDLFLNSVGITCRPVLPNGSLGPETTVGATAGGTGGQANPIACRIGEVVATAEVRAATYVDLVVLGCRAWDPATRQAKGIDVQQVTYGNPQSRAARFVSRCEFAVQPVVGIRGRAGNLVDAIGFICDEP